MADSNQRDYRKIWEEASQRRQQIGTNVLDPEIEIEAVDALLTFLDYFHSEFLNFAKLPPHPSDKELVDKIAALYDSLEEFRKFLSFDVLEELYDWNSREWEPVVVMLDTLSISEEFTYSWGIIHGFYSDLVEYETVYNRDKLFVALNSLRRFCRQVKKASKNLDNTKKRWKQRFSGK